MSELPSTPTETMGPRSPSAALGRPVDMGYLEGTIGYTIRRAQLAVFQDIYREFGDTRITLTQFSVMAVAADNPEVTQAELAEVLAVERPRIVPSSTRWKRVASPRGWSAISTGATAESC